MSSIREQILSACVSELTGTTPAGNSVFRERDAPISRDMVPGIVVFPNDETDQLKGSSINESILAIDFSIYTRGDPADQLADPIALSVHSILMASAAIGALVHQVRKNGSKWERHEADQTAGVLTMTYQFRYLHQVGDLAAKL